MRQEDAYTRMVRAFPFGVPTWAVLIVASLLLKQQCFRSA